MKREPYLKGMALLAALILHATLLAGAFSWHSDRPADSRWRGGGGYRAAVRVQISQSQSRSSFSPPKSVSKSKPATSNSTPGLPSGPGLDATGPDSDISPSVLALIRKRIDQHKLYPTRAQDEGLTGRVGIRFAVDVSGRLLYVKVVQSSGSTLLDRAAIDSVKGAVPLPYMAQPVTLALDYQLVDD